MKKLLEASPLFHLSLTNKELFHSNFLAWFGHQYPEQFKNLFDQLLGDGGWPKDLQEFCIDREYKHFDICIRDTQNKVRIIIENKVKSVPTKEQLNNYRAEVNNDCIFILLTMTSQLHDLSDVDGWNCITYSDLSRQMMEINVPDCYHSHLISDYREYIKYLHGIIKAFDLEIYYSPQDTDVLKELGIHDIVGKRRVQFIYRKLLEKCRDKGWNVVQKQDELTGTNMMIGWGFTDRPLIEVKFNNHPEIIIIQIQGNQYRHAIEFFDTSIGDRIIKNDDKKYIPSENGLKYLSDNYSNILSLFSENRQPENYPSVKDSQFGKSFGNRNTYCKYCNGIKDDKGKISCFVYQWVPIPQDMTIDVLVETIIQDAQNIKNLYSLQ